MPGAPAILLLYTGPVCTLPKETLTPQGKAALCRNSSFLQVGSRRAPEDRPQSAPRPLRPAELIPRPSTGATVEVQIGFLTDLADGALLTNLDSKPLDVLIEPAGAIGGREHYLVADTEWTGAWSFVHDAQRLT